MSDKSIWRKAVDSFKPHTAETYYTDVVHTLMAVGCVPLPKFKEVEDAMEDLREACSNQDPRLMKSVGAEVFDNHDRSMDIHEFICHVLPVERLKGKWLLPVEDDGEYISWTFIFVPQDIDLVMEMISSVKKEE